MRLKAFLEAEKLTTTAFGRRVGVTNRSTMSRYVRCERFPPPDVLVRIREVTAGKVTADDFVDQHRGAALALLPADPVAALAAFEP